MSINKVILIGNVGKDPEVKRLESGVTVASVTLAVGERGYKLKNGTDVPERTDWFNIIMWKGLAEIAEKYVKKGDKLYVEGKIRIRSYADKAGVQHYITEIYAEKIELLTKKDGVQESHSANNDLPF